MPEGGCKILIWNIVTTLYDKDLSVLTSDSRELETRAMDDRNLADVRLNWKNSRGHIYVDPFSCSAE